MNKVFVYGTLKRGHGNNRLLLDSRLVGSGQTVADCRLFDAGFPVLRRRAKPSGPFNAPVRGEVYEVTSPEVMARLDRLEGEGHMYHRKVKKIRLDDGRVVKAFTYVGDSKMFKRCVIYPAPHGAYNWGTQWSEHHS